jgi:uncharacterized membrane protein YjgN (DUF898 family)
MTEQAANADGVPQPKGIRPWSASHVLKPPPRVDYEPAGYVRLLKLHVVNTLLTVVTLSIWRFWAITRMRRLLWAHIRFDGQPLEYTGTGVEIFVGFLKVVLLILLPAALVVTGVQVFLLGSAPHAARILDPLYVLGLLWLVALGKYLGLRYRTSRTRWRGIRGRLAGTVAPYLWLTLWTAALTVLTLGLFKPWMDARRIRYALHGARAGSLPVTCQVSGGNLFWSWLVAMLLWPFSFGLSYFWYKARVYRLVADRTVAGPIRFGFTASGWSHAWLTLSNMALLFGPGMLIALTLTPAILGTLANIGHIGAQADSTSLYWALTIAALPTYVAIAACYLLFMPIVWERRIRFVCRHLVVLGAIDLAALRQAADDRTTAGEGLVGDFDAF